MTVPPVIDEIETIREKRELLNVLGDIEVAQSLIKEKEKEIADVAEVPHPLDTNYGMLHCDIKPLPDDSEVYQKLVKYLNATKQHFEFEVLDIFEIRRHGEEDRFNYWDNTGNRKLLWHGTNVAVIVAILSGGLRIMPHSGGRVGKGIYFASEISKSANYVRCTGSTGILFLSEVVLGKQHSLLQDDWNVQQPPDGYDSIIARGHTEPDPTNDTSITIDGKEIIVPQGKPIRMEEYSNSSFTQSEYLVYREDQNRLRFLVKLKFKNHSDD